MASCRYSLVALGSFGIGILFTLKSNFNIVISFMVNHTANGSKNIKSDEEEGNRFLFVSMDSADVLRGEAADDSSGIFPWTYHIQTLLVSAYFWGYITTQILGGRLAELWSAKWIFFIGIVLNIVFTIAIPICAYMHYGLLMAIRILQGMASGVCIPSMHALLAKWTPPAEKNYMTTVVYIGSVFGTMFSLVLSGFIATYINWEAVFYISAAIGIIWTFCWAYLVSDIPADNPYISQRELRFLTHTIVETQPPASFPINQMCQSVGFWAILCAHFCNNWCWFLIVTELPLYLSSKLNFKISENVFLTAIPYLAQWIFSLVYSRILDCIVVKQKMTSTTAHKVSNCIGCIFPGISILLITMFNNSGIGLFLTVFAIAMLGAHYCGFFNNHIDLAPNFAGTMMGITNTVGTIPPIVAPLFIGWLVREYKTGWRTIFWSASGLYLIQILVYTIFAIGEEEDWNTI